MSIKRIKKTALSIFALGCFFNTSAQLSITATQVDVLCNGANTGSIDITVSGGVAPYAYQWSTGFQTQDVLNLSAGNYGITVTDAVGTTLSDSFSIVQPTAVTLLAGSDVTYCSGASATLDATASGGVSPYTYVWLCNDPDCFLDNNVTQNPIANPIQTRTYFVLATDDNGCASNLDSMVLTVNQTPVLTASNDTTLFIGQSTQMTVSPGWYNNYNWQPDLYLDNNAIFGPTATPDLSTTYVVTVTSDEECVSSDTVVVTVDSIPVAIENTVNNLFTPNGDGVNDFWMVRPAGNAIADVVVYNRWGKQVFAQQSYQNDWDGTSSGEPLPEATYYYVISVDGQEEKVSGAVSLVRLN